MDISVFGKSDSAINLCNILHTLNTDISGIYDKNLQSAVEFAALTDSKAYFCPDEAIESSDVIILTDNEDIRSYISIINKSKVQNKILCMISRDNTSDKIYTDNLNTHFSIYSPALFDENIKKNDSYTFMLEGFGIRYTEFTLFLASKGISYNELSIDDAKVFYSVLNLYTNGLETLIKTAENTLGESSSDIRGILKLLTEHTFKSDSLRGSFFTNDTYSSLKTLDTLKSQNKPSLTSLYKIIGLNALEYTPYNKEEKDHYTKILLDN